jgi:hypothetical protein
MLRAMKRLALILPLLAPLADCGGSLLPFELDDDAGGLRCVSPAGDGMCTVRPGACDAGPDSGNPNANDLSNSSLVPCNCPNMLCGP